jgi:hypothetical protein
MRIEDTRPLAVLKALFQVVNTYAPDEDGTVTLRASEGRLRLRSASGGCAVEAVLRGDDDESLAKPLSLSRKAVAAVSVRADQANLRHKNEHVTISSGRSRYRIPVQAVAKQGRLPDVSAVDPILIGAPILKAALQSIHFGHDDTGTGDVRVAVRKGVLTTETADAFRAAVYQERMPELERAAEVETSLQHAPLLKAVAAYEDADLKLRATERACALSDGATSIYLPVLSAPRYRTLDQLAHARKSYETVATISALTDDLRTAIREAIAVLESKSRVPVEFAVRSGRLHMTTHGELGTHEARMPAEQTQGRPDASFVTSPAYVKVMAQLAAKAGDRCQIEILGDRVVVFSVRGRTVRTLYLFSQKQRTAE